MTAKGAGRFLDPTDSVAGDSVSVGDERPEGTTDSDSADGDWGGVVRRGERAPTFLEDTEAESGFIGLFVLSPTDLGRCLKPEVLRRRTRLPASFMRRMKLLLRL